MSTTHIIPQDRAVAVESVIHIIECAGCSIDFGIGDDFMKRRREDHQVFYCPNGHPNVYRGDNEAEKLRKQVEQLERQKKWAREDAKYQRERRIKAERQRAAAKGQVTKIRNRVAAGVCPCCNRTFQNLARHMEGQHPDWANHTP